MGARVLATDVHVWREDQSAFYTLAAGSIVPEWAEELVTNPKAFAPEVVIDDVAETASDVPATYGEMKNDELKALLKGRELPTSGTKDELVARLLEDDAEKEADEDETLEGDSDLDDDEE